MKSIITITVRGYHIDYFGHVNHGRYVELLEEARWRYLEENGLIEVIHEITAVHVVSRLEIDYRHPARTADPLRFETHLAARTSHGFRMDQNVFLGDSRRPVLNARVFNVFVNSQGRPQLIDGRILQFWSDLAAAEKIQR